MESPPFIPSPPSLTSSNDSYFIPQIYTDTMSQSPELDLHAIYRSQRSRPYPRPVLMSSSGSINLSNVSPAESSAPLPIPHPATPAPPAMSPRTTQSILATNNDIDATLLWSIVNGLLTTIASSGTRKPSSGPQRATCLTTAMFPTSASHVAKGSLAQLSGSNSMTME